MTYEIASWFAKHEWKVFVFTSEFDNPIAQEFRALDFNVLVFTDQDNPELIDIYPHLDFCWIHHQYLPGSFIDFLADGGEKPWMAFNHMSPYEQLEYPVVSAAEEKLADIILCNSQETFDVLRKYFDDSIDKIKLFQNPAPVDFYEAAQKCDKTHSERLSRVAIVSNHPPTELKEAALLLQKKNVLVNFIGMGQDVTARVTPSLLNNYDAVITIGKTVQYGLAIKKPIYIYDHFGGSGYLSKDNFQENEHYNFSGRSCEKKTAEQIADEIITNYLDAGDFVRSLSNDQLKRFLLDDQLLVLLNQSADYQKKIISTEHFCEIDLIKAYSRNLSILLTSNSSNNAIAKYKKQRQVSGRTSQEALYSWPEQMLPAGIAEFEQQATHPITSQQAGGRNDERRSLKSFKVHLNNTHDDLSRLIYKWNLESITERGLCEVEGKHLLVSGWVLGNTSRPVYVATRQHGVTRCYPLNMERRDVTQAILNDASENPDKLLCGFKYMVGDDAEFDFGFEVDGWIFWIYSGVPA